MSKFTHPDWFEFGKNSKGETVFLRRVSPEDFEEMSVWEGLEEVATKLREADRFIDSRQKEIARAEAYGQAVVEKLTEALKDGDIDEDDLDDARLSQFMDLG